MSLDNRRLSDSNSNTVLLFSVVSLGTYFIIRILSASKNRNWLRLPPSLPSLPMIGSFPFMMSGMEDLPEFFKKTSDRLGPMFGVMLGTEYVVVLNTREIIYEALVKQSAVFSGREPGYSTSKILNPDRFGILNKQYGVSFRKFHQITLSILKEFGFGHRIMQERILEEIEELIELIKEKHEKSFDPSERMTVCTINIIASIVFGERISQTDSNLEKLALNLRDFVQGERRKVDVCPALRFLPKFKAAIQDGFALQFEHFNFIGKQVANSLESERDSFVKRFVEQMGKDGYDKDELRFIIRDLLVAGSDTTSTTVQFALIQMANYPDIQRRIQEELDTIVDINGQVTLEDTLKIPYLEATILEIFRTRAVVPLALPHLTLEDAELGGYFIPKGTTVYPNIHSAHMDSNLWKEPEKFSPERFLDEEGKVKGRELVIPFSLGKRSCLGELLARQEVFLIITNLILKFNILPPEGQDSVVISKNFLVTLFPSPYELRFIPRK